jgi:IS30 family transposase
VGKEKGVDFSLGSFLERRLTMTNINPKKCKHLTLDDRIEIQECLNKKMTFKAIGKLIEKDQTTISKEIKKHLHVRDEGIRSTDQYGNAIAREICPELLKAPFVCNACSKRHVRCKYSKQFYHAKNAQAEYESLLSEAREGIPLTKESFYEADRIISEKIEDGQHLYHIIQSNELGVSKSTVYRHLKRGYLSVSPVKFPRVLKFKPRRKKLMEYVPKAVKKGRMYEDFLTHIAENDITSWVEMDTLIGRIGGKAIVTFDFTVCNLMFGLLISKKTSFAVSEKISKLKSDLNKSGLSFAELLPLILTDNGGEFADVASIENNFDGERETMLFFCDPYRPSQKPRVEKNHTLFRDIVPKATSFDDFSQDTVNLIFSHVNSVRRKKYGGKSPYEMFTFIFGEYLPKILGIESIPDKQVIQSPKLLKGK